MTSVSTIMQDNKGFIWLATESGLLRYDGQNIKRFEQLTQFTNQEIELIVEGEGNKIWIATGDKGLASFNTKTNTLTFHPVEDFLPQSMMESGKLPNIGGLTIKHDTLYLAIKNRIFLIDQDSFTLKQTIVAPIADKDMLIRMLVTNKGDIWASSYHGPGPMLYKNSSWRQFKHVENDETTVSNALVLTFFEDSLERVWLGTYSGLDLYMPETELFKRYPPRDLQAEENKNLGVIANLVSSITEDELGNLWLALYHGGIFRFQPEQESFLYYQHVKDVASTNISNAMTLHPNIILFDQQQTLWALTQNGIGKLTKANRRLTQWVNKAPDKCLPNAMYQHKEKLYFGCKSALYVKSNNQVRGVTELDGSIFSITAASDDSLWVGTNGAGIYHLDADGQVTKRYQFEQVGKSKLVANMVKQISIDQQGRVYGLSGKHPKGTGSGIVFYDQEKDQFKVFDAGANSGNKYSGFLNIDETKLLMIRGYTQESNNLLWFDKTQQTLTELAIDTGPVLGAVSWRGSIWLSTGNLGLIRFDGQSGQYQKIPIDINGQIDGLYSRGDKYGLVFTSHSRLYQLDIDVNNEISTRCISCSVEYALPEFNHLSSGQLYISNSYLLRGGDFLLRNTNRLMYIPTAEYIPTERKGNLVFTDYKVMGNSVIPDQNNEQALLQQSIDNSASIVIPPQTSLIAFSFAKLGMVLPDNIQYAYKLEGLNSDWIYTEHGRPEAIFSLLAAGDYTLMVKATNENGEWQEQMLSLDIRVLPPWWKTWWALTGYVLLFVLTISCFLWTYYRKILAENKQQSLQALAETKEQLFANLSHEFRTPLTLILGPAQILSDQASNEHLVQQANLIERNAKRLLSMVDQLLLLAQLKSDQQEALCLQSVQTVCHALNSVFQPLAANNAVTLSLEGEIGADWAILGANNALETILSNLLTNAFKFTPPQGAITFRVDSRGDMLVFSVQDTGCGIAKEQQQHIFERFTRVNSKKAEAPGVGIGLALVKELVLGLEGTIDVESELDKGSRFSVSLPRHHLAEKDIVPKKSNVQPDYQPAFDTTSLCENEHNVAPVNVVQTIAANDADNAGNLVLLVEDNIDMQSFIESHLRHDFQLITAANGKQGLEMAKSYCPDIIISDVMMPEMDGFELLSAIRSDMAISHIPFVLLTAKGDSQSKLQGLSDLADDYITKPFEPAQLTNRLHNLLALRAILQQRYTMSVQQPIQSQHLAVETLVESDNITNEIISVKDQQFIDKLIKLFEQEHADAELSVPYVAGQMAMSERQLQRKVKAVFGITFSELLRDHRLTQACSLLLDGRPVAVVAELVGFNSSSYFVRCFKAKYGKTPNEYRKAG